MHSTSTANPSHFVDRENTFEPERNLNCPELLQAFLEKLNAGSKGEKQQAKSSNQDRLSTKK